jgi:hypothetical protein
VNLCADDDAADCRGSSPPNNPQTLSGSEALYDYNHYQVTTHARGENGNQIGGTTGGQITPKSNQEKALQEALGFFFYNALGS